MAPTTLDPAARSAAVVLRNLKASHWILGGKVSRAYNLVGMIIHWRAIINPWFHNIESNNKRIDLG